MHHQNALSVLRRVRDGAGASSEVDFISPIVSTILAAGALRGEAGFRNISFSAACLGYAKTIGLQEALRGEHPHGSVSASHGESYSRLTKLARDEEIDVCNEIIGNLLVATLSGAGNSGFINAVAQVVGELHSNVPAHASAAGFSAAQVYRNAHGCRLEFAIADCGKGMLKNVQRVEPGIVTHADAIEWCLKEGNTTAEAPDPMAQWLPEDSVVNPYPSAIATATTANHHIGRGLWCLTELIRKVDGQLWIYTGNAAYSVVSGGRNMVQTTDLLWEGLALEIEIDITKAQSLNDTQLSPTLIEVARRLGL